MDQRYKPPKSYIKRLKEEYSRKAYGYSNSKVEDFVLAKLVSCGYGVMAWISTKNGAEWAFECLGIEEVDTHPGYKYYFQGKDGAERRKLSKERLRIFRETPGGFPDIPQQAVEISKRVIYSEKWSLPEDRLFTMAYSVVRSWMKTSDGDFWARERFQAYRHTKVLRDICYRAESQDNRVYWLSQGEVSFEPEGLDTCQSCQELFPCTDNYTSLGELCIRCYSENFGTADLLSLCNRHECENHSCQNHIGRAKFKQLTAELNESPLKWRNYG